MTENDEQQPSGGISRRTVTKAMAWAVPVIAIAAPAPAFAVSGGIISFTGTGCKLPGNSNATYKGYVFGLIVENTSNTSYVINILSATLGGVPLGGSMTVNLSQAEAQNGVCPTQLNPFTIPANTPPTKIALVTKDAPSSQNNTLLVTYTVNGGEEQTKEVTVPAVPPINGNSCPISTFTDNEKKCVANAVNATLENWAANTAYNVADAVKLPGGEVLVCTIAGTSAGTAPLPPAVDATVVDGTVTWQRYA